MQRKDFRSVPLSHFDGWHLRYLRFILSCVFVCGLILFQIYLVRPYGTAADIYSFGMILHELVTNDVPLSSISAADAAREAAVGGRRPDLSGTDEAFANIVRECCDADPSARPTAAQLVDRLAAVSSIFRSRAS